MNIFNDKTDMTFATITDIEVVEQQKQEFKLLGTYLRTPGLSLFCWNPHRDRVESVEVEKQKICILKIIDQKTGEWIVEPLQKEKVTVNSTWEYFEALNIENAKRRVQKFKDGKIKYLFNLRIPGPGKLDIKIF